MVILSRLVQAEKLTFKDCYSISKNRDGEMLSIPVYLSNTGQLLVRLQMLQILTGKSDLCLQLIVTLCQT